MVVRHRIRSLVDNKVFNVVYIRNKGEYDWNSVYRVYNRRSNYEQLRREDLKDIDFEKCK